MSKILAGLALAVAMAASSGAATVPEFSHELWGRTYYGDGYVYGPAYRSSGVSVVDIDLDGDNDFVLPAFRSAPQIMRNLGNSRAFYPGGPRDLNIAMPAAGKYFDRYMDFADVNGDGRPDFLVVIDDFNTGHPSIVWYKNAGPADSPAFSTPTTVLTSALDIPSMGPLNWADIDGDGLKDLCFIEFHLDDPSRSHRLFVMKNVGTATNPLWSSPVEETALSSLMPPRYVLSKSEQAESYTPWLTQKEQALRRQKSAYDPRVFDFEFADWDQDGDLDFLLYDTERGVDWVRNLGSRTVRSWDTTINGDGSKPYTQPVDPVNPTRRIFGSFAVRSGAFAPDFYVSIQGPLLTWRYDNDLGGYRVVQQNAVAYETGQGQPAFWDYDGDGDLDLFCTGTGGTSYGYLLMFKNVGMPYEPVWGQYSVITNVLLGIGSATNDFRQDLMTFKDVDYDGAMEFFVQGQTGAVMSCSAARPSTPGGLPTFTLQDLDTGNALSTVLAGQTGVQPRGMAIADFDPFYVDRILVACATDSGGKMLLIRQSASDTLAWLDAIDVTGLLKDENGATLSVNRIESMAATDLDKDGFPDLVVTLSDAAHYQSCSHYYYRNTTVYHSSSLQFAQPALLDGPHTTDPYHARMIAFADIDTDGDDDLFIGHQYYDPTEPNLALNRYAYLRFYRNGSDTGLNYWQTRVVSGQTWRYTINGVLPNYDYILDASGGNLSGGVYTAGPTSQVVDIIESTNASPNYRVYIDVLPSVGSESKAILVIGGAGNDALYPTFRELTKTAYSTLLLQGLQKQNIRIFAPASFDADGDGVSDVYGARSISGLRQSVVSWANGSQRLLVYLIDHGQRNRFHLTDSDYLEATDYASWVNQLQQSTPNSTVTTVIDTCEAASFIPYLKLPSGMKATGAQRITIAGSGVGPTKGVALFDTVRNLSFSLPFWQEIYTGGSYGRAFDRARVAIESINPLQQPKIDDNGNGVADEAGDGLLADSSRAGADFVQPSSGVYVGEIASGQVASTNTATLWLSDVVSSFPVEAAGALIVPPNLGRAASSSDDEQPLTGLVWVDFTYNVALKRWESSYSGFTEGGLYRVQYYVSALGRYYASPRIGTVDRINVPDGWEADNTADTAKWLPINLSQGHNFHASGDEDWVRFTAPSGAATIAALPQGPNCQPRVRLYKRADLVANPNAAPVRDISATDVGGEVEFNYSFPFSEQYLLRITNANGAFGAGTSYLAIIAVGTGGIIPPSLVVSVLDAGAKTPIANASVQASASGVPFTGATSSDGVAQFVCSSDQSYTVTAAKSGYQTASQSVLVNNQMETLTLFMTPTGSATAKLTLSANCNGVKVTVDGSSYDLPQSFTWVKNTSHTFSVPTGVNGGYVWSKWSDGNASASRSLSLNGDTSLVAQYTASGAPGDIDNSGEVNAVDVQLVINGALSLAVAYNTDINGDHVTDAVDVQMVINAVLAL